jgi:hypothetical protein
LFPKQLINFLKLGLWIPFNPESFLDNEKPFTEEEWRDILTKIGTVDFSDDKSIVIFVSEPSIPLFGQLAADFGYKFNILYWYRPNIVSRKNTFFSNNIVPICILSTLDKLNYPTYKNAGSNQIICPAITAPTLNPHSNTIYHIDEKPWALYWNIIRLFYSPNIQVSIFLFSLNIFILFLYILLIKFNSLFAKQLIKKIKLNFFRI